MKKSVLIFFIMCGVLCMKSVFADSQIRLIIGGELVKTDVNPIIINDRTMVPVRAIFEKIGAEVMYNADEKTVTAVKKDKIVELTIDSNIMKINGAETKIESPAVIINDRTFVPVRASAEAFDLDVEWIENSRTVKIKKEVSLLSELSYSDGRFSKITYDENGNTVFVKESNGDWCKYEYDSMGDMVFYEYSNGKTGRYAYDENNNVISIRYSDGSWVEINYDEKGREKTRRNSDGSTEEKIYNENEVTTVYSGGNFEKCVYDNMQNLIYYQDIHGKWEKFGYDENGNMLCYQNDSGYWEKYSYDENGSKLYFENSNGLIEQYSYDDKNKKVLMKNSDGYSEEYTYDKNGNLSYMNCSDGTWYKYKYDEDGNMIYSENDRGNITQKTYDENGNLLVEEYPGVTYKYIVITK